MSIHESRLPLQKVEPIQKSPERLDRFAWYEQKFTAHKTIVETKLHTEVVVLFNHDSISVVTKARPDMPQRHVGKIDYRYEPTTKLLYIQNIAVEPDDRDKGVGQLLLTSAVLKQPDCESIETVFGDTNAKVFARHQEAGDSDVVALQKTPAFKMRLELGFTKNVSFDGHALQVSRE